MELYPLKVFLTVATERSFSRAGEKLLRTQPAISIAIQRLESDLKEKLIDRSGRELLLTDAGRVVLEYARRFQNLEADLENALRELKDNYAGRLSIGANESTTLYLIQHIEQYRRLFPKVKVQVRRSESSKIPSQLLDGELELGVISYDPGDDHLQSQVISTDRLVLIGLRSIASRTAANYRSRNSTWRHSLRTMFCRPIARRYCGSSSAKKCR